MMKTLKGFLLSTAALFLFSCSATTQFPISNITPGAEITANVKKDANMNYVIAVLAKNLANANRLNPPKSNYVVWIVTEDNGTKNIGQMYAKNGKKSTLKTTTVFKPKEIFITAEDQGIITYPSGIEISRMNVSVK